MVQVIQAAGPSEATLRQQALNQGLQSAIQGLSAYGQLEQDKQATLRQQALDQQRQIASAIAGAADYAKSTGKVIDPKDFLLYQQELMSTMPQPGQTALSQILTPSQPQQDQNLVQGLDYSALQGLPANAVADNITPGQMEPVRTGPKTFSEKVAAAPKTMEAQLKEQDLLNKIALEKQRNLAEQRAAAQEKHRTFGEQMAEKRFNLLQQQVLGKQKVQEQQLAQKSQIAPKTPLDKLSAEARGKVGSVVSGLSALDDMQKAISQGFEPQYIDVNTPFVGTFMSDTPFTQSQRVVSEVVGRLQSGGAINAQEMKNFNNMGPRPGDTPEMVKSKINAQKNFLENKLTSFGIKEDQLSSLGYNKAKSTAPTQKAPTQSAGSPWAKFGGK